MGAAEFAAKASRMRMLAPAGRRGTRNKDVTAIAIYHPAAGRLPLGKARDGGTER